MSCGRMISFIPSFFFRVMQESERHEIVRGSDKRTPSKCRNTGIGKQKCMRHHMLDYKTSMLYEYTV